MQSWPKILVVDDDPMVRELIADLLGSWGYEVVVEPSGREALESFTKLGPWQLVVLDLRMPGMSGLEVLEKMREGDPQVEVIIVTAYADTESAIQALSLGAFDYLTKPIVPNQLKHRVERALDRHRLVSEQKELLRELKERIQQRTRELEAVKEIAVSLIGPDGLKTLLDFVLAKVLGVLGGRAGVIYLIDEERGELVPMACRGFPQGVVDDLVQRRIRVGEGLCGQVAERGEPVFIAMNTSGDPRIASASMKMSGVNSYLSVPLRSREKVVGVFSVVASAGETCPLSTEDLEFVATIGHQLGVAIENARLFQDVTRSEALWENTFDSVQDLISVQDGESRLLKVNKALAEKLKASPQDLIGRPCSEVRCSDPWVCQECSLCQAFKTRQPLTEEVTCPLGGTFLVSAYPLLDRRGEAFGYIHIARDITKRKEMEEQVRHSEKLAAVGQLAVGLAHEMGNAIAIIGGATQFLIKNTERDHPSREFLEVIDRSVTTADGIIRDLLSFARPSPPVFQPLDVRTILDKACLLVKGRCEAGGIRIQKRHVQAPLQVQGDAEQLEQVFVNLILNAVQAMPRGGMLTLAASVDAEGEWVRIEIADTGVGIPPEYLDRIFDPFFTTKEGGTGLGLSVTYRIVQVHRGRITVESQEGEGTRFTISLPASQPGGRPCRES